MKTTWEPTEAGEETDVDQVLQQYLQPGDIGAGDSGPGSSGAPTDVDASGESSEQVSQIVERVMGQVGSLLDQRLGTMRQDLQTYAERTAQSFSDKTANRLTQRQREQMAAVDLILAPLKEKLGPEFDDALRQAKMDVMLSGSEPDAEQTEAPQAPPAAPRPAGGESDDKFASAYLTRELGDPSLWSEETLAAINTELSQASDWSAWMAVVDRYAKEKPARSEQGQGLAERSSVGKASRAQPVGATAGQRASQNFDQLDKAFNKAVAEGDLDAVEIIGKQIDRLLAQS